MSADAPRTRRPYGEATLSLVLLFGAVLVHGPVEIYRASPLDLDLSLRQVLALSLPALVAAVALGLALLRLLPARAGRGYGALLAGLAVAVWAGGSFFPSRSGAVDGNALELDTALGAPLQTALWLAVALAAGAAAWRLSKPTATFLLALNLLLAATSLVGVAGDPKPPASLAISDAERTRTGRLSASPHGNVVIVLLDALQSDVFYDVVTQTPGFAARLDGFTYFKNALGVAPTTYLSMPAIYAGLEHRPGGSIRRLTEEASEISFLHQLAAAGVDVVHANPYGLACPSQALCVASRSAQESPWTQRLAAAAVLTDLSLFRALPLPLARLVHGDDGRWWLQRHTSEGASHSVRDNRFFSDLVATVHVDGERPALRFVRLVSTHKPIDVDERCRERRARAFSRRAYRAQTRCALEPFMALLGRLEELGVYDDTAILLIADHGVPCCLASGYVEPATEHERPWALLAGAASPAFAFKPFATRGPLSTSLAPVQLVDVGATVCALVPGCRTPNGRPVTTIAEDETRRRTFVTYRWGKGLRGRDALPELRHLTVVGKPYERASWIDLGAEGDDVRNPPPVQARRRSRDRRRPRSN